MKQLDKIYEITLDTLLKISAIMLTVTLIRFILIITGII
jgi:hypothetical protein